MFLTSLLKIVDCVFDFSVDENWKILHEIFYKFSLYIYNWNKYKLWYWYLLLESFLEEYETLKFRDEGFCFVRVLESV